LCAEFIDKIPILSNKNDYFVLINYNLPIFLNPINDK
jgi:hypothetical protein